MGARTYWLMPRNLGLPLVTSREREGPSVRLQIGFVNSKTTTYCACLLGHALDMPLL
jgi:hypothetical protein